jgi:hypothetical protein
MKTISFLCLSTLIISSVAAQEITFDVPSFKKSYKPRNLDGYYHSGLNKIIVAEKLKNGVGHFLYDTSFKLIASYEKIYTEDEIFHNTMPLRFAKEISFGSDYWEAYACDTAVAIHKLDFDKGRDTIIALAKYTNEYKNAELLAILPQKNACIFLCLAVKKKRGRLLLYRWLAGNSTFDKSEYLLPESSLSETEQKKFNDLVEMDYGACFQQITVSQTNHPDLFQLPAKSQVFYNDSAIYLVNNTPYSTGINVLSINYQSKQLRINNYFLNELDRAELGTATEKHPVATIFDSTLAIENCSDRIFEYHFFNVLSGAPLRSYKVRVGDSLSRLVHSPYQQVGTFVDASKEIELEKGKQFIRRKNNGVQFLKPALVGDSLVLTFGSLNANITLTALLVAVTTAAMGYMANIHIGNTQYIPYLVLQQHKLLFAHSKFAINGWGASKAANTSSILDQLIAADKLKDVSAQHTILIDLHDKLYLAVYNNKSKVYEVSKFYQ